MGVSQKRTGIQKYKKSKKYTDQPPEAPAPARDLLRGRRGGGGSGGRNALERVHVAQTLATVAVARALLARGLERVHGILGQYI